MVSKLYSTCWIALVVGTLVSNLQAQSVLVGGSGTVCPGSDWWVSCTLIDASSSPVGIEVQVGNSSQSGEEASWSLYWGGGSSKNQIVHLSQNGQYFNLPLNATLIGSRDSPNQSSFVVHRVQRVMDGLEVTCYPCADMTTEDPRRDVCIRFDAQYGSVKNTTSISVLQRPSLFFVDAWRITGMDWTRLDRENSTALIETDINNSTDYLFCRYGAVPEEIETTFNITLLTDGRTAGNTVTQLRQAAVPLLLNSLLQLRLGGSNCGFDSEVFYYSPLFFNAPVFSDASFSVNARGQATFVFNASGVIHNSELFVEPDALNVTVIVISEILSSGIISADLRYNATLDGPAELLGVSLGGSTVSWEIGETFTLQNLTAEECAAWWEPPPVAVTGYMVVTSCVNGTGGAVRVNDTEFLLDGYYGNCTLKVTPVFGSLPWSSGALVLERFADCCRKTAVPSATPSVTMREATDSDAGGPVSSAVPRVPDQPGCDLEKRDCNQIIAYAAAAGSVTLAVAVVSVTVCFWLKRRGQVAVVGTVGMAAPGGNQNVQYERTQQSREYEVPVKSTGAAVSEQADNQYENPEDIRLDDLGRREQHSSEEPVYDQVDSVAVPG